MQQFHSDMLETAFPDWKGSFQRLPQELKGFAPAFDREAVRPCSFWSEPTA